LDKYSSGFGWFVVENSGKKRNSRIFTKIIFIEGSVRQGEIIKVVIFFFFEKIKVVMVRN
jgi:hypothetical protein